MMFYTHRPSNKLGILNRLRITFLALLSGIFLSQSAMSEQFIQSHGTVCKPANLGQAMALDLSWSHLGTTNFNAIGSGKSFFVVCPITGAAGEDGSFPGDHDVYVHVQFLDPAADDITCTISHLEITEGSAVTTTGDGTNYLGSASFANSSTFIAQASTTTAAQTIVTSTNNDVFTNASFSSLDDSLFTICALPPQTRVMSISIDHD